MSSQAGAHRPGWEGPGELLHGRAGWGTQLEALALLHPPTLPCHEEALRELPGFAKPKHSVKEVVPQTAALVTALALLHSPLPTPPHPTEPVLRAGINPQTSAVNPCRGKEMLHLEAVTPVGT